SRVSRNTTSRSPTRPRISPSRSTPGNRRSRSCASNCCHPGESPLLSGILASVSSEGEAGLRVWWPQRGWFGRQLSGFAQVERAEQADLELGEQEGGTGFETAGDGVMQDAQQHEGDQRDVDLDAHGVFAAAEEAADFQV